MEKIGSILVIGAGNMGGAFARGIGARFPKVRLFVCDKDPSKIADWGPVPVSTEVDRFLSEAEMVVLAVKPQSFAGLCGELGLALSGKLVVSVMAGVSIGSIREGAGASRVVRSMPNLPAKVGRGLTGWFASSQVTGDEKEWVRSLFSVLGESVELDDESRIDAVTALSGSGPAYFFRMVGLLESKALEWGFSADEARKVALATLAGSAELMGSDPGRSAKDWVASVASKGGTTEAALRVLDERGWDTTFDLALEAAKERAEGLNRS